MSASCPVCCGVPQGVALGPQQFVLYVADAGHIIAYLFGLTSEAYADDGQVYSSCPPLEMERLRTHLKIVFKRSRSGRQQTISH